ncbi:hypothetical protein UFOVP1414_52 [uncultured Caudovirales phage]|uniref:Uncharacterized protein n=1 Tax=uncultured Caudovirales phage TaxID=2100421 RepID=A0A6J5M8K0_9CAUD|nr:hypothetical protein UFOVP442_25 [uncultured Caudovirales phage]CAB4211931.1 hypothetical protein UFOVP1414_52 [uncultured Caudovirales phage]
MCNTSLLTIFEGPDGGGKTTAAKEYATLTSAQYIHHGSYKGLEDIGIKYVESILPALVGCYDVVLDRSWHSEKIYGDAFRNGADRLGDRVNALNELANMCGAVVILCLPPLENVLKTFNSRRGVEMLQSQKQMEQVYADYSRKFSRLTNENFQLEVVCYDYTTMRPWTPTALNSIRRKGKRSLLKVDNMLEMSQHLWEAISHE